MLTGQWKTKPNQTLPETFLILCVLLKKCFLKLNFLFYYNFFWGGDFHVFVKELQGSDGPCHFIVLFKSQLLKFPESMGNCGELQRFNSGPKLGNCALGLFTLDQ